MRIENKWTEVPSLGKESWSDRLRRYALALVMAVGIMGGLFAVFFLILALSLPFAGGEDAVPYDDVAPVQVEAPKGE